VRYLLLLALFPISALAGGSHTHETTVNVTNVYPTQSVSQTVSTKVSGVALGIATSQLVFDAGTSKTQISAGIGSFDDSDALAVGIGKKIDNLMLNGSIGFEDGKKGYGAGVSFKF